jgi:hypothetical protein
MMVCFDTLAARVVVQVPVPYGARHVHALKRKNPTQLAVKDPEERPRDNMIWRGPARIQIHAGPHAAELRDGSGNGDGTMLLFARDTLRAFPPSPR